MWNLRLTGSGQVQDPLVWIEIDTQNWEAGQPGYEIRYRLAPPWSWGVGFAPTVPEAARLMVEGLSRVAATSRSQ